MADAFVAHADFSGLYAGIDQLTDRLRTSVARTMAVAAGAVLRDEAKARAPEGTEEGGSITPGLLKSAIYLAYKPTRSVNGQQVYSVSWNHKKAPHGHMVEFGYLQTVITYKADDGEWYSNPDHRLVTPRFVPPHPFLQPAYDASLGLMRDAAIRAGRARILDFQAQPDLVEEEP